ncbi:Exosome complex component CSL4 [Ananas comosus]|uniref:Exosome complex component CSL4 n=1 Tax=Ananas comosus TaxID=4615 RepID=A0A199V058_ANACO|nr:Exosome complex component CSL4 [Ananas comosus]
MGAVSMVGGGDEGDDVVTPGELLGDSAHLVPGRGAYLAPNGRSVRASLTGTRRLVLPLRLLRPEVGCGGRWSQGPWRRPATGIDRRCSTQVFLLYSLLLQQYTVCVCLQVTKVMARIASADIMCVQSKAVREKFTGIIRQQDVRATEIDKVDMYQSFRPGDIVRALVLSLGDARAYYLTTAKNELGVVSAQSIAGGTMIPISWTEMQCPLTGQVEQRKVAKVD